MCESEIKTPICWHLSCNPTKINNTVITSGFMVHQLTRCMESDHVDQAVWDWTVVRRMKDKHRIYQFVWHRYQSNDRNQILESWMKHLQSPCAIFVKTNRRSVYKVIMVSWATRVHRLFTRRSSSGCVNSASYSAVRFERSSYFRAHWWCYF